MLEDGSTTKEITIKRGEIVTYKGKYEKVKNQVREKVIIYLEVKTEDGKEGYIKLSSLTAIEDNDESTNKKISDIKSMAKTVTSRAGKEEKTIGKKEEQYVIAIAAGRNSDEENGIENKEKGLVESELTIKVAEKVEKLLKDYSNVKVIQTGSTSKKGIKAEDRVQKTRNANANLCVQIYFGDGENAGVETIYKKGDDISQQFAEILSKCIATSMGLTNLNAGEDIEKCKDSEGNGASLSIIENAAITGYPSVVAIGGNLNKEPDVSVIAGDGVDKYAQGIVNGIDEYFKADHSGRTATEDEKTTYKDSTESRIINMKYVSQEKLQEYVSNGNFEKAIKSYTIDDDRNLVIVSWSRKEDGSIELTTNNSMSLKTALKQYVMPYEYLLYFYMDTDYKDFVEDLADEVMNSEIVMAVQDNVTTTHTIETTNQRKSATVSMFEEGWHQIGQNEKLVESVSTSINVTYVKTWCVKAYQENSYSKAVLNMGDEEEKIFNVPGKVTENSSSSASTENAISSGTGTYEVNKVNEKGKIIGKEEREYQYTIYEQVLTNTHSISNTYEKGEYKTEGRENVFIQLYKKHDMIKRVRPSDYLYAIIENNEKTAGLLDLTKYLIYKATNIPWGVLEFKFDMFDLSKFNNISSMSGGLSLLQEYIHYFEGNEGISEDGTKYRVGDDGAGNPTVGYGVDIYNSGFLDRFLAAGYDVSIGSYIDVDFVDALELEELQSNIRTIEQKLSGLNLTQYQKFALVSRMYNCGVSGALGVRNGKDFVSAYGSYWDQEKDDEYKTTPNDGMYNHPLYQNYMNKPVTASTGYLPGLEIRRKSEWILFKTGYCDVLGKWCSDSAGGAVVEKAVECHAYLRQNNFTYAQAGINIPISGAGRTVDCSSYVSWVLYEAGYSGFEGYQKTSYTFEENPWGWQDVNVSDAQPGDIVAYAGHVEIVAGDEGDRFRVYNCGGNASISAAGTSELPESSTSGHTKGQVTRILRPPQ